MYVEVCMSQDLKMKTHEVRHIKFAIAQQAVETKRALNSIRIKTTAGIPCVIKNIWAKH